MSASASPMRWFSTPGLADIPEVGGKSASLGELASNLAADVETVATGFALTPSLYREAPAAAAAWPTLHNLLDRLDVSKVADLATAAAVRRAIVCEATGTPRLQDLIAEAYAKLTTEYGPGVPVAVRSGATAEDLPPASFAGQHESFLNINGLDDVVEACRRSFASLFADRAIVYRVNHGFDHFKMALSVGVMKMVRSIHATSGAIFTLDAESGFRDVVFVTDSYGLGGNVVQGKVDPDKFYVHKPPFCQGHRAVRQRKLGRKRLTMGLAPGHFGATTADQPTPLEKRARFCVTDAEVLNLADQATQIEDHYSSVARHPEPMDIESAKDPIDGRLYIVRARSETVASRKEPSMRETYTPRAAAVPVVTGKAVGSKIAGGMVRAVGGVADLAALRPGEVLVAAETRPDREPVTKTAGAIVTDHGGRACHVEVIEAAHPVPDVNSEPGARYVHLSNPGRLGSSR